MQGFYQQQPAYRLSHDLGLNYQIIIRVYQRIREAIYHIAELEGGKRKGKRGRGAKGKNIVFGILERNGRVYTRVVEHVSAEELMAVIRKKTRKGSVYYTDIFRSYNSLKRLGKHHKLNHSNPWLIQRRKTISTA